jgi:hypothetical protein
MPTVRRILIRPSPRRSSQESMRIEMLVAVPVITFRRKRRKHLAMPSSMWLASNKAAMLIAFTNAACRASDQE